MSEGTKGGESRPPSVAEIKKLPRSRCALCGMEGPKPMVVDGRCRNDRACELRRERKRQHEEKRA